MLPLRALFKALAFSLVTVTMYLFLLVSLPFAALGGSTLRWRARMFRAWAPVAASALNLRVRVIGRPPRPPFFLVSNHLSYVDVVVLASQLDCVFVAKSEVARWPVLGRMCRTLNTLFVDRSLKRDVPRVIERIHEVMDGGLGVVVFPEGTSSAGQDVLKFKPALLEAAARARIPVSYASLCYVVPGGKFSAQNDVCWWGDMTFAAHCARLFRLPGIEAVVEFGERVIEHENRKVLAETLHRAVRQQFRPVPS